MQLHVQRTYASDAPCDLLGSARLAAAAGGLCMVGCDDLTYHVLPGCHRLFFLSFN
jgi:hypothetical protein